MEDRRRIHDEFAGASAPNLVACILLQQSGAPGYSADAEVIHNFNDTYSLRYPTRPVSPQGRVEPTELRRPHA